MSTPTKGLCQVIPYWDEHNVLENSNTKISYATHTFFIVENNKDDVTCFSINEMLRLIKYNLIYCMCVTDIT